MKAVSDLTVSDDLNSGKRQKTHIHRVSELEEDREFSPFVFQCYDVWLGFGPQR